MKYIMVEIPDDGTRYVPVPCRGIVKGLKVVWQTNAVEPNDTVIASRDTTAVNTVTATATGGLTLETGVRDATNPDLVFDPDSTTVANRVIKLVANGTAGISIALIEFDDFASVTQEPLEA